MRLRAGLRSHNVLLSIIYNEKFLYIYVLFAKHDRNGNNFEEYVKIHKIRSFFLT